MSFAFYYNPETKAPFAIYIAHEGKSQDAHWKPAALLGVTAALRDPSFLRAIGPDEFKSLLLLLSFLSSDGRCAASVPQLAGALRLSHGKARARFERLAGVRWQGQNIVFHTRWGNGLDGFSPAPGFIPIIEEPAEGQQSLVPPMNVLPREVVIEHSRRTYARNRADVEQEIEEMMNWRRNGQEIALPQLSPDDQKLREELIGAGLFPEQADDLMKRFDAVHIRRQLAWLPLRMAKNKAGYLMAAVKDNYAAPKSIGHASKQEGRDGGT